MRRNWKGGAHGMTRAKSEADVGVCDGRRQRRCPRLHCAVTSQGTSGGPFQDGSLVVAMQDLPLCLLLLCRSPVRRPFPLVLATGPLSRQPRERERERESRSCPPLQSPRNPGNSNEGYFTQSTVPEDFPEIPVLDTYSLFVPVVPPLSSTKRWQILRGSESFNP